MSSKIVRAFNIVLRLSEEGAEVMDDQLSSLQNWYFRAKYTRSGMLQYLLKFAVRHHWSRLKRGLGPGGDEDRIEIKGDLPDAAVLGDLLQEVRRRRTVISMLDEIYHGTDPEEFVKLCEENGINWRAYLEGDYGKDAPGELSEAEQIRRKLTLLLSEGPRPITAIRSALEGEGLVRDETDWSRVKVLACREGFSGKGQRGTWSN